MLKPLQAIFDANPEISDGMKAVIFGAQQFDLNVVLDLVAEMAEQNSKKLYPMFRTLPCKKSIILLDRVSILVEANGDEVVTSLVDEVCLKLSAGYLKNLSGQALRKCIALMIEPHEGMIKRAFDNVKDVPKHVTIVGAIRQPHNDINSLDTIAFLSSCCFDLMSQQNLFVHSEEPSPRHFRKRHENIAEITHKVVDFRKTYSSSTGSNEAAWHGKALHFVVGHWRRSAGGKSEMVDGQLKTWIAGHWRGNPEFGIVAKSYKAGNTFLASIKS